MLSSMFLSVPVREFFLSVLAAIYPDRCAGCGARRGERTWCSSGQVVPGLRFWDAASLCCPCRTRLEGDLGALEIPPRDYDGLKVVAGCWTHPELVELVGAWKYHGLRGLAWPLAEAVLASLDRTPGILEPVDILVPVPLHSRRRRIRGFNQAKVLAHLVAGSMNPRPGVLEIARRQRATAQQAQISDSATRTANVEKAFRVQPVSVGADRVGLVDDLVTSGATVRALAMALRSGGWNVRWVLALGAARDLASEPLVSGDPPFTQVDSP